MSDADDAALTPAAPTELSEVAVSDTEAGRAWALDDEDDDTPPTQRLTPARITALGVAASLVLMATAATVVFMHLRGRDEPAAAGVTTTPTTTPGNLAPVTVTQTPPPPPTRNQPPAPVTLPMDTYGEVHVRTVSGQTVCAMTAGDVNCNVHFTNRLGPVDNGMPSSGVGVNSRGAFQWLYGDPGNPDYVTMAYGTVYKAMGWIITPTSQGTTFMYDATGHGMTLSVDGFSTF